MYEEMNGSMQYSHGIANFNLNSMTTSRLTHSYPDNDDAVAVEYANGYVYMITAARSDYYLYRIPMGSDGNLNSEPEYIAELERFGYYVDMAYDSVNRVMYTLHRYDGIYTIDVNNGTVHYLGKLDNGNAESSCLFMLPVAQPFDV